ncbi:MAG: hypothetical protein R3B54_18425 [Bdellovibrionota bacterium]
MKGRSGFRAHVPCLLRLENWKADFAQEIHLHADPGGLSFQTGSVGVLTAEGVSYGFYYPPKNTDFEALKASLPPLLVKSHGGPTTATTVRLNPGIQFGTSRGFAVLDVHGGSTGYGRSYMKRLEGRWGIVDGKTALRVLGFS